ncbi:MAG: MmcQ/YjbR family DNA-binding protein [Ilumatobacter fluminis]|uniref:MmcQ/YjbR family DNA-binding protein n=1 Tax=Ilumatobacter fluminis TaxID=467091 RepID=UPI0032EE66C5
MAKPKGRAYVDDVPEEDEDRLRAIGESLPDAYEERAWVGVRWRVRKQTFAQLLAIDDEGEPRRVVLTFRSQGEELEVLKNAGHPFFLLGWGRDAMGMVIDDDTDWDEVAELVTESYCTRAPKKLIALLDRPPDP